MREILFRGQSLQGGWVFGYLVRGRWYTNEMPMSVIMPIGTHFYPRAEVDGYEEVYTTSVGEYTGLTDRNGTKIFEGDVVREVRFDVTAARGARFDVITEHYMETDNLFLVEFVNDRGGWVPFANGDGCGCCEDYTFPPKDTGESDDFIVIGNIHDNPELLEECRR